MPPESISFRPATKDDYEFLRRVYDSTREDEMALATELISLVTSDIKEDSHLA